MSQVSKYPISDEVYKRCWEVFNKALIDVKNPKEAQEFVNDLLTPIERIMLVKRVSAALLLIQGYQYREISQLLRLSLPTISMVSRSLKFGSNGYKKILTKILNKEEFGEFFNQAAQKLVSLPAKGGVGSGSWKYLKQKLEKKSANKKPF